MLGFDQLPSTSRCLLEPYSHLSQTLLVLGEDQAPTFLWWEWFVLKSDFSRHATCKQNIPSLQFQIKMNAKGGRLQNKKKEEHLYKSVRERKCVAIIHSLEDFHHLFFIREGHHPRQVSERKGNGFLLHAVGAVHDPQSLDTHHGEVAVEETGIQVRAAPAVSAHTAERDK